MDLESLTQALSDVFPTKEVLASPKEIKLVEEPGMPPSNDKEYTPVPVSYIPSQKHIDKNWAPETRITEDDVRQLARATKVSVEKGVLKPELAAMLLPMAMVEGRPGNYGVKESNGFYAKPSTMTRFLDMGLLVKDAHAEDIDSAHIIQRGKNLTTDGISTAEGKARTMAAILSEKSSLKGIDSVDKAVMKYNGTGKAIERLNGALIPADTEVYLSKVKEADRLLKTHPTNKKLLDLFNKEYMSYNGK